MSLKSIFQEGMKERKRRKSLGRVNRQLKDKEKVHSAQLTALGQKAWESKVDLTAHPELKAALGDLQQALDDLRSEGGKLLKLKQESEAAKQKENERLNAGQRELEEKKRQADGRLSEQRKLQQDGQAEIQRARSRLSAIAAERGQIQGQAADPAVTEADKAGAARSLEKLAREEGELQAAIRAREEAGRPAAAQAAALQEEASRLQRQLDDLRGEQRKMAAEMDKKIAALAADLARNAEKTKETELRRQGEYKRLGERLAAAGAHPALAKEMTALQGARAEMEGVQALISGLERQKDEAQVSAYKKMMAILIGGIALLAAIVVLLVLLLAPKRSASPLGSIGGPAGVARNMEEIAQRLQEGMGGIKEESERIQGGAIELAGEGALKAALPQVAGWQPQGADYSQGAAGDLKTASLRATYAAGGDTVRAEITDAGTASALLAPLKMAFALNLRIDNAEVYQQTSAINGIPVAERVDKRDNEATIGIIYKDRYLIEFRTRAAKGLELLREFAARLNLSEIK